MLGSRQHKNSCETWFFQEDQKMENQAGLCKEEPIPEMLCRYRLIPDVK